MRYNHSWNTFFLWVSCGWFSSTLLLFNNALTSNFKHTRINPLTGKWNPIKQKKKKKKKKNPEMIDLDEDGYTQSIQLTQVRCTCGWLCWFHSWGLIHRRFSSSWWSSSLFRSSNLSRLYSSSTISRLRIFVPQLAIKWCRNYRPVEVQRFYFLCRERRCLWHWNGWGLWAV